MMETKNESIMKSCKRLVDSTTNAFNTLFGSIEPSPEIAELEEELRKYKHEYFLRNGFHYDNLK